MNRYQGLLALHATHPLLAYALASIPAVFAFLVVVRMAWLGWIKSMIHKAHEDYRNNWWDNQW